MREACRDNNDHDDVDDYDDDDGNDDDHHHQFFFFCFEISHPARLASIVLLVYVVHAKQVIVNIREISKEHA